jgi:hypothetical protein
MNIKNINLYKNKKEHKNKLYYFILFLNQLFITLSKYKSFDNHSIY